MPKKRLGAEQIVTTKLRQIEVMQGQGKSIASACKEAGITEQAQGRMFEWRDLRGHEDLRYWWFVAERGVWTDSVVMPAPALDDDLSFS